MNRQRIEIMTDILTLCTKPSKKTRIMYQTNLSYAQLINYLAFLTSHGLLLNNSGEYEATEKGLRFLDAFARLSEVLQNEPHIALNKATVENVKEIQKIRMAERRIMKPLLVRLRTLRSDHY